MSKRNKDRRKNNEKEPEASSAQAPVAHSDRLLSRRQWLGLAASGLTAAAIGGGIFYRNMGKNNGADTSLSDEPITQQDVDREYAALYANLSEAKRKADEDGKKLVVLAGEVHNNRNSLLLQFMLVDIAHRLGITEMMEEADKPTLGQMESDAAMELRRRDRTVEGMLRGVPDPAVADFTKRAFLISAFKNLRHDPVYSVDNKVERNNTFLSMMAGKDVGMHFHAVDPTNKERYAAAMKSDDQDIAFAEKFEKPMFDEITNVTKKYHALGFLGAGHVPELCKQFKDSGAHVVGIDCTGGVRLRDQELPPLMRQRMDALDNLYVPSIKSRQQPNPGEALAMTLTASLKHQQERGEINDKDAGFRMNLVEKIRPKDQVHGARR